MPKAIRTVVETPAVSPAVRPLRADAARNRQRILEVAEQVFAARGVSVPVDVVAEEAGVGVGTLYRHFPTKEDLYEAIVLKRLEALVDATTECRRSAEPGEALFRFLRELASQALTKRDLFEALNEAGIDFKSSCAESIDCVEQGLEQLLDQAKAAGQVRRDVTAREVLVLVTSAHDLKPGDGDDAASAERMLDIVLRGLRP